MADTTLASVLVALAILFSVIGGLYYLERRNHKRLVQVKPANVDTNAAVVSVTTDLDVLTLDVAKELNMSLGIHLADVGRWPFGERQVKIASLSEDSVVRHLVDAGTTLLSVNGVDGLDADSFATMIRSSGGMGGLRLQLRQSPEVADEHTSRAADPSSAPSTPSGLITGLAATGDIEDSPAPEARLAWSPREESPSFRSRAAITTPPSTPSSGLGRMNSIQSRIRPVGSTQAPMAPAGPIQTRIARVAGGVSSLLNAIANSRPSSTIPGFRRPRSSGNSERYGPQGNRVGIDDTPESSPAREDKHVMQLKAEI